ncbi:MAG TPA: metal-dependent hydrolase [Gemmataceae bacterium]|nr:metal-dependent hydrolase [Gemmataceae bacterium]
MANFRGHISTSGVLGVGVGVFGYYYMHYDWGTACLAGGLTTIGGMLPDLDSDSGIPVRELFGLASVLAPLLLFHRVQSYGFTAEQLLVVLAGIYLVVRYGLAELFRRVTVHRGMFHSVPAMIIAGLAVFVMYRLPDAPTPTDELRKRLYLAAGTMIGFLSHLVLDELFAVNLMGVVPKLNQFAGSALKLKSDSWGATALTYAILCTLGYMAWMSTRQPVPQWAWE